MITQSWKNIVGLINAVAGENTTASTTTDNIFHKPINNVVDVEGNVISTLLVSAYRYERVGFAMAARNNATLFNGWSDSIVPTEKNHVGGIAASSSVRSGGCSKVVFGTGSAEEKVADYCLESPVTEGITLQNRVITYAYNPANNNYETIITVTAVVDTDITLSEVGIIKTVYNASGAITFGDSTSFNVLALREVLETPLNLKAGDSFTISIMIEQ